MRLFRQELFKIINPLVLAVLAVLGVVYFFLFASFSIEYFSNGENAKALFQLSSGWAQRYGPTLEPEERAELDGQRERMLEEFSSLLAGFAQRRLASLQEGYDYDMSHGYPFDWEEWKRDVAFYQNLPFHDYNSFLAYSQAALEYQERNGIEDWNTLQEAYPYAGTNGPIPEVTNYYQIQALDSFLEAYDSLEHNSYYQTAAFQAAPQPLQERIRALDAGGRGYLPQSVLDSTSQYAQHLALWVVLSVVLLLSPTLVRDRLHRMRPQQWASRQGRVRVLQAQMAAALVSALVLTVVNLAAYALPYLSQGPLCFRDFSLYNRYSGALFPWFDWSFGAYLLVLVGMCLLLGLGAGALTGFLSQYSGNYVAMLLKAVPLFLLAGALFAPWVMKYAFFNRPVLEGGTAALFPGAELLCVLALLALGAALCALACWRQGKRELLGP